MNDTCMQETLDQVVLVYIIQNGITFVVDHFLEIREDYYQQKYGDEIST